jgi:hypothetical protein
VNPEERRSIDTVRVRTPSRMVALPWDSAQAFLARCRTGQDDVPQIVRRFQAVGTASRQAAPPGPSTCSIPPNRDLWPRLARLS